MSEDPSLPEYYNMPAHGWTCFHCGETFMSPAAARMHFGFDPSYDPACRIKLGDERTLVRELRFTQRKYIELLELQVRNDTAEFRHFYALGADHAQALRRAEEQGYEKGLRDGRALGQTPPQDAGGQSLEEDPDDVQPPWLP